MSALGKQAISSLKQRPVIHKLKGTLDILNARSFGHVLEARSSGVSDATFAVSVRAATSRQ